MVVEKAPISIGGSPARPGHQLDGLHDARAALGLRLDDRWSFVVVARLRSFTEAAAVCHLSQPGMSARIVRLEKEIGWHLVDRQAGAVDAMT